MGQHQEQRRSPDDMTQRHDTKQQGDTKKTDGDNTAQHDTANTILRTTRHDTGRREGG
jgi:hypothetical protein